MPRRPHRVGLHELDALAMCGMGAVLLMLGVGVDVDNLAARGSSVVIVVVCALAGAWLLNEETR